MTSLKDIGINEFYDSPVKGGYFTMKSRFEDFVVKEINNGTKCETTNIYNNDKIIEGIRYITDLCSECADDLVSNSKGNNQLLLSDSNVKSLYNLTIKETIELGKFQIEDKEKRKILHESIRNHPLISSKTDKDKNIVIFYSDITNLIYKMILRKTNRDTIEACHFIAGKLDIPFNAINFAGNKDRRAITFQEITIQGCHFIDLYNLAVELEENNNSVQIFGIRQTNAHLRLGELEGNNFEIKIRPLMVEDYTKLKELDFTKMERGFINYYGHQRFGKYFDNHIVGEMILKKEHDKAIEYIMRKLENDDKISKAREFFVKGDFSECLKALPSRYHTERMICKGKLKKLSGNRIFKMLRNETLKLYLHAYQSYIFNIEATKRVSEECDEDIDKIYLELKKENNRHLKGAQRKLIEKAGNVTVQYFEDCVCVAFDLKTSSYATMALREVIGDDVVHNQ